MKKSLLKSKWLVLILIEICILIFYGLWYLARVSDINNGCCTKVFIAILILSMLLGIGFWALMYYQRVPFFIRFGYSFAIMTMLYSVIMLPKDIPDSSYHFTQAYCISNEILGVENCITENGNIFITEDGLRNVLDRNANNDYSTWISSFWGTLQSEQEITNFPNDSADEICDSYSKGIRSLAYVIPAIGITLARILKAPYQLIFLAGVWCNAIFACIMMILSMKLFPKYKEFIAITTFLPTFFLMINSYSYDNWNYIFSVLLIAYCLHCRERAEDVTWKDILIILLLGLPLLLTKFVNIFLIFLIFYIPRTKVRNFKRILIASSTILGVCVVFLSVIFFGNAQYYVEYLSSPHMDMRGIGYAIGDWNLYTFPWIFSHIPQVIGVYINTIVENGGEYIINIFAQGTVLDYQKPLFIVLLMFIVFFVSCSTTFPKGYFSKNERIGAGVIVGIGCFTVLFSMMFVFSTYTYGIANVIRGVQGRYFLPYMLLMPILLSSVNINLKSCRKKSLLSIMIILNMLFAVDQFVILIH